MNRRGRWRHPCVPLLATAFAVWLAGCSQENAGPTDVPGPSLGKAGSAGAATSYLVLADGDQLPDGLERSIRRAGGRLEHTIPEVGVAVASSRDPDFRTQADGIGGILPVALNPEIQWVVPPQHVETVALDAFSDPPTSGDDDFFFDLQWGHDAVDSPEAWNAGARGAGVRIAILDSGIDADHPDIAPNLNLALSTSFVPGEAVDDMPAGFNHGTHVAGIAGAADNAFGTIGVAAEAELVAVKVLSAFTGSGSFGGIIAGIVYAANIDADVINMSLGATLSHRGEIFDPDGNLVAEVPAQDVNALLVAIGRATTFAHQQGTTVIASAGNAATDGDADQDRVHTPSDAPHVLSISATGPLGWAVDPATDLDVPAFYTNFGQSVIDFAAPGGNVDFELLESGAVCTVVLTRPCWVFDLAFSTSNGGWAWAAGTSMAAPHATGVAAVIIGQNGGSLHPAQVSAAIRAAADDLGPPGNDDFFGAGRVNAGNTTN